MSVRDKNKAQSDPRVLPWQEMHRNPRYRVYRAEVQFGDFTKVYYPADHGPRVGVVVPWDGGVLLVKQWRLQARRDSWELPGGKVDEGETPAAAAMRECLEETGLRCGEVEHLVHYLPGMDNLVNPTDIFLGQDVSDTRSFVRSRDEVTEWLCLPLEQCLERVARGDIVCGMTIMGLLAFAWRRGFRV